MPIEIDYAKQPIEKSIKQFEAETLSLFESVINIYDELHEIDTEELFKHLRLPRNNLDAARAIYEVYSSFQHNYNLDKNLSIAYKAKALFSGGRFYRATQALSAFRQKYYSQLTTSDSDLNFAMRALEEISAISYFFYHSSANFSTNNDQILNFLHYQSPLVIDIDNCVNELQESIDDVINTAYELAQSFIEFFRIIKYKLITAAIQHVDTEARQLGIRLYPKDCKNLLSLQLKLQSAPHLLSILLKLTKYTMTPDAIATVYAQQVNNFHHFSRFQRKIATDHLIVSRCLAISQDLNIISKFTPGNCEGAAAILLHSDLSQYYTAPRLTQFDTYKDIDNFFINKEMFTRQRNQFTKSQTSNGEYFALTICAPASNNICASIISNIYLEAYKILKFSSETKANIMVHLRNEDTGHAIAFQGYSVNADDSINFLMIDLNFGIFRFKLFQSELKQQPVIDWLADIYNSHYSNLNYFQVIQHYIKSPTQKLYSQSIENNNAAGCKAQALLATNLQSANFAARYDAQKRNRMLSVLNLHVHGNCDLQQLTGAYEEYSNILDKTLVDHLNGLWIMSQVIDWYHDMENFSAAMSSLELLENLKEQQTGTILGELLGVGLPWARACIQEMHNPGSGKKIIAAQLIEQQKINADQKLLDLLSDFLKLSKISINDLDLLRSNINQYYQEKFDAFNSQILSAGTKNDIDEVCRNNPGMLELYTAYEIVTNFERFAIVDEDHRYYSVLAQDKPNLRIIRAETKLPITLLFSPSPERPISCANNSYENTNQQLTVYKPRI